MQAIVNGVNELLTQHSNVESGSVRVRFLGFGASSLNVELYAYVKANDWSAFLNMQQGLSISRARRVSIGLVPV